MRYPALKRFIPAALMAIWAAIGEVQSAVVVGGPVTNNANGHRYYLLSADTWESSQTFAASLGGNLATIEDAAEQIWIFDTFGNYGGVIRNLWIGLSDQASEGSFVWANNSNSTYRNWAVGADNGLGDRDVVCMLHPASEQAGRWLDIDNTLAEHDGHPICGIVEIPKLFEFQWRTRFPAYPVEPVALSPQGQLFVVGGDGKLRAIDPNGRILWEYPASGRIPSNGTANLVVRDDGAAVISAGTNVIAVSSNGVELWRCPVGEIGIHWLSKMALSADGMVICAARSLIGIDASGRIAWRLLENEIPDGSHSEIAINGEHIFFAVSNVLHKISINGRILSKSTLPYNRILGISVVDRNHILAAVSGGATNAVGYSKIDSELAEVWFYSLRGGDFGDPASVDTEGRAYVTNGDGIFASIEPTGLATWRKKVDGGLSWRPPIVTKNGLLVFTDGNGRPVAYDRSGAEVWRFDPLTTCLTPVIGLDGRTIWPSSQSQNQWEIVCYSTTEQVASSIWPMHRGDSQRTGRAQQESITPVTVIFGQSRLIANQSIMLPVICPKVGKVSLEFSDTLGGPWERLLQISVLAGETPIELPISSVTARFYRARFSGKR